MSAYYNDSDPDAAAILRQLIVEGVIAPGDVDDRDIREVQATDLVGYAQHHFFAGGGFWSIALRMAGWPDDRSIWSGSCPCQPISVMGRRRGEQDPRHLWPDWFSLLDACRPPVVMGEQVTGTASDAWIDGVFSDLERAGYACRAIDIPACAVNLPHIRERRWFAAHSDRVERRPGTVEGHGAWVIDGREARDRSRWPPASEIPRVDDGVPGGVALRRISGNAVSPALAAEVIAAYMEAA